MGGTKKKRTCSSEEEDSDVERNFALLQERGGAEEELQDEECEFGEEEEELEEEDEDDDDDDDEGPEEAGCSRDIQTTEDIKKELSTMSFEDVMKLQSKVGTRVYHQVAHGEGKAAGGRKKKRLNKNRPMEISAKKRAPFLRQVVGAKKTTFRDPRFDDLSGEYKASIFEKTYAFVDHIRQHEMEVIQKKLKKTKGGSKKEQLSFLLKRMTNQEKAREQQRQQRERELQIKREQRERANQGAPLFFLKKSDKRKLQLADRYQQLKKSGKLESFLSKRRKRNAGKDRRKLPRAPHHAT